MPTTDTARNVPRPSLPVNSWAILGLLSFGTELSGYQLRQWAENILGYFHSVPAMSQIYTELQRLERHGYVHHRSVPVADAPVGTRSARAKRGYEITPEGREALAAWIRDVPVEYPTARNGAMLRVWLGAYADPERLREIVSEHRDRSEEMRASAEASNRIAEHDYARHRFATLVTSWAERRYAAERDLAKEVLSELDELLYALGGTDNGPPDGSEDDDGAAAPASSRAEQRTNS
ncbi:PadR family transcriptional regulator [Nocardiopsis suaedae]|uniref:PadR family transcriptional regulator n=1 Tax=Nocardiopsis suaedae TaxID=3018444 RepID=A0ABT4TRC3_9ACTN|nr:PadR family transcriptional regulator [Nocardiopsis suaedae]MDA2807249.1 PadR family transcriptional regulator [Nocardiopsis suaedae]